MKSGKPDVFTQLLGLKDDVVHEVGITKLLFVTLIVLEGFVAQLFVVDGGGTLIREVRAAASFLAWKL